MLTHLLSQDPDPNNNNNNLVRHARINEFNRNNNRQRHRQSIVYPTLPSMEANFVKTIYEMEQQFNDNNEITYLSNADFKEGTYRIQTPGIYKLTENILLRYKE